MIHIIRESSIVEFEDKLNMFLEKGYEMKGETFNVSVNNDDSRIYTIIVIKK